MLPLGVGREAERGEAGEEDEEGRGGGFVPVLEKGRTATGKPSSEGDDE